MLHKIIAAGLIVAASQAVPVSDKRLDRLERRLDEQSVSEAGFNAKNDWFAKRYPACIGAGTDYQKFLECKKEVYCGNLDGTEGSTYENQCEDLFKVAADSPMCKCMNEYYRPTSRTTLRYARLLGLSQNRCVFRRGGKVWGGTSAEWKFDAQGYRSPATTWFGHRTPQQCMYLCGSKGYMYTVVPPDNNCQCADAMSTFHANGGWKVFKDAKAADKGTDVVYPPTGTGDMSSTTDWKGHRPVGDCMSTCIEEGYDYAVVPPDFNCKCASAGAHSTSNDANWKQYQVADNGVPIPQVGADNAGTLRV